MRKRPIILAAAVTVAGLAALGTLAAQPPSGGSYLPPPGGGNYSQPKVTPAGGTLPATTVRPYNEWTPTPPAGGARPSGGSYLPPPASAKGQPNNYPPPGGTPTNRPRLTRPAIAGDVRPAGGIDIPPPSLEMPSELKPGAPPESTPPLAPPSVSVDGNDNKFPSMPAMPAAPASPPITPPAAPAPLVPVPPAPGGVVPLLPTTPAAPTTPPGATPKPLPLPSTPAVGTGPLPSKSTQTVTIEAICPGSVVYGTELRYELVIRNSGIAAVKNVRVEDELPAGVRYVGSDPPGELSGTRLTWSFGAMEANTEKRIAVRVRPDEEGEIRSRATVTYSSSVEARTKVTRPRVAITASTPEVCRVGEDAYFQIKVTNSGTGPAQNMVLTAEMSEGFYFPQNPELGRRMETRLASLPAGQSTELKLPLNAVKSGAQICQFSISAEGCDGVSTKAQVNVVEPLLKIAQTGPEKCLVRAEPTYEITLSNPGTAATDPITLNADLPDGFDFVQASDGGAYNATGRVVTWKLTGLQPSGTKAVAVKLRAAAAGDAVLRAVAVAASAQNVAPAGGVGKHAGRVLQAKGETAIKAEGVAAVRFEVKDLDDPVEVGKEAVYEIRVTNQGTGACTNVQLLAALSDGTTFTGSNGPTTIKAQGQTLVFDPIQKLPVKGEMVYTVRVKGNAAGDQRLRVQLTCDQVRTPVVKEESTSFYKP